MINQSSTVVVVQEGFPDEEPRFCSVKMVFTDSRSKVHYPVLLSVWNEFVSFKVVYGLRLLHRHLAHLLIR